MEKLTDMPNIGSVLAEMLQQADIKSAKDLKNVGSEQAFIRIAAIDNSVCLCKLYALEGAVQNKRWHSLSPAKKEELKQFFHQLSKKK